MSRSAEGNFDIDLAAEILLRIVNQLIDTIKTCLDPKNEEGTFCGEIEVMPAIDILVTLGRAYPDIVPSRLREEPITEWKETYLSTFERSEEKSTENKPYVVRRKVIVETFSNLEKLAFPPPEEDF